MTKRKDKQTQPESLSKREKQWLDKVDWDLHEQLEMEEEGQPVPMQDFPSQSPVESSETPARGSLTSGALSQEIKNLTGDYIGNSDKVAREYKEEQPDDKIPNPDVETLIQKLYQSREAMPMEAEDDDKANSNGK